MSAGTLPVDMCAVCGRAGTWVPVARVVWHLEQEVCELPPLDRRRTRTVMVPVEVPA